MNAPTFKHTPVPWAVMADGSIVALAQPHHGVPTSRVVIAEVPSGGVGIEESKANARLIAVAPRLLETLRGLLDRTENGKLPTLEQRYAIGHLIATAEGRAS